MVLTIMGSADPHSLILTLGASRKWTSTCCCSSLDSAYWVPFLRLDPWPTAVAATAIQK